MKNQEIPPEVAEKLGHYVYLYVDPRNGKVMYVGKGVGNRAIEHLSDRRESKKVRWIQELRAKGFEPRIEILARRLATEDEAQLVERCVIDAIGLENLTNIVRGHDTEHGRELLGEIVIQERNELVDIQHYVLLFNIKNTFKPGMCQKQIYEMTRGFWLIKEEHREKAQYAFGVFNGTVRGVFSVDEWHRAVDATIEEFPNHNIGSHRIDPRRWFFTSNRKTPDEISDKYLYKSVSEHLGGRNPVIPVPPQSGTPL
ncbi:MAG: hypothetical protein OXF42_00515 [Candidatus Dadabacteria bacterium]|nr:hypothetical protein [Candidatus Dadabacteria bacterium]